jgi:nucleotide-binding universal stress UspA family protein
VVVGFDGSSEASAALRYAAGRMGGAGVIIAVYAEPPAQDLGAEIEPGMAGPMPVTEPERPAPPNPREHAVFQALPGDTVDGTQVERLVVFDRPARALIGVARDRDADEIVIGTRRHGRVRAALSSVSHDLIHDADRPVVIVPPPKAEVGGAPLP